MGKIKQFLEEYGEPLDRFEGDMEVERATFAESPIVTHGCPLEAQAGAPAQLEGQSSHASNLEV